jgi:GNAT superfamily N-acetyltransferase
MPEPEVRAAAPADVAGIVRLCAEHARFERAEHDGSGLGERLGEVLFGPRPPLMAWVVEGEGSRLLGYASATLDLSTWSGRSYLHLDCLYLDAALRGQGYGRRLMSAVMEEARRRGCREVQWQTPSWNMEAIGFYERLGARGAAKVRFTAAVRPAEDAGTG